MEEIRQIVMLKIDEKFCVCYVDIIELFLTLFSLSLWTPKFKTVLLPYFFN